MLMLIPLEPDDGTGAAQPSANWLEETGAAAIGPGSQPARRVQ
jgi:hypothetical protein